MLVTARIDGVSRTEACVSFVAGLRFAACGRRTSGAIEGDKHMKKVLFPMLALAAVLTAPAAHADNWLFTATLTGPNEVPPHQVPGNGLALLNYDDHGTASLGDDTYDFTLAVFELSGPPTGYHIHGAATLTETAPVRVSLADPPFVSSVMGNMLMISGNDVAVPTIPETPASATNAGHPAMSFLDMLRDGLGYVNVHTAAFPGGEVRGQLMAANSTVPVPEPASIRA
jgi:hypothetical protein